MGFMDKFKGAGSAISGGLGGGGMAEYAQLANKLAQSGVPCTAEIQSIDETGKRDIGSKEYAIAVQVEGNGEPYEATVNQYLPEGGESGYEVGSRYQAKADPDDPAKLLLFGSA
jgi:hypothetical protein